jgi:hypothetical protein
MTGSICAATVSDRTSPNLMSGMATGAMTAEVAMSLELLVFFLLRPHCRAWERLALSDRSSRWHVGRFFSEKEMPRRGGPGNACPRTPTFEGSVVVHRIAQRGS